MFIFHPFMPPSYRGRLDNGCPTPKIVLPRAHKKIHPDYVRLPPPSWSDQVGLTRRPNNSSFCILNSSFIPLRPSSPWWPVRLAPATRHTRRNSPRPIWKHLETALWRSAPVLGPSRRSLGVGGAQQRPFFKNTWPIRCQLQTLSPQPSINPSIHQSINPSIHQSITRPLVPRWPMVAVRKNLATYVKELSATCRQVPVSHAPLNHNS